MKVCVSCKSERVEEASGELSLDFPSGTKSLDYIGYWCLDCGLIESEEN